MSATSPTQQARRRGRSRPLSAACAAAWLLATAVGCGPKPLSPFEQPRGVVESAPVDAPPGVGRTRLAMPGGGVRRGWPLAPHLRFVRRAPDEKLHPIVRRWLSTRPPGTQVEVLIGYVGDVALPVFPNRALDPRLGLAPDSAGAARADSIIASIRRSLAPWYARETSRLARRYGARVAETFWITRAARAFVRLDAIPALARRYDVASIQPARVGFPPPGYCDNLPALVNRPAVVSEARAVLGSDVYRTNGYATGRFALLDTGVYPDHVLLANALTNSSLASGPVLRAYDCVPSSDCTGPETGDAECLDHGHGTKSSAILIGKSASMGDCVRGVTDAWLDSYRVYSPDPEFSGSCPRAFTDPEAFKHACQHLRAGGSLVAVLEVADAGDPEGDMAAQANALFRSGLPVIAAAGNGYSRDSAPEDNWIGSPACARLVMPIGARETKPPRTTLTSQSRGVVDERQIPAVQAPSKTNTAGSTYPDEIGNLSGTSGATPYAGAAALLLRNWMAASTGNPFLWTHPDPGQVYAAMIACASNLRAANKKSSSSAIEGRFPPGEGAGLLRLPQKGRGWWGKVSVGSLARIPVDINVDDATTRHVRVAIWWPDPPPWVLPLGWLGIRHSDVDLVVIPPEGVGDPGASSGPTGVFERVGFDTQGSAAGRYTIVIAGRNTGLKPQTVYWTMIATP